MLRRVCNYIRDQIFPKMFRRVCNYIRDQIFPKMFRRVCNYIRDQKRKSIFFPNEFFKETFLHREDAETITRY